MNISTKMYSDGFYKLSTKINGNIVSVTYSEKTPFDEAFKDFKEYIQEYKRMHYAENSPV